MTKNITFKLVSPSQDLLNTDTAMVIVPGVGGDMGIMKGHSPVISTLRAGEIILRDGDTDIRWFIEGGFVEVSAEKVIVLAEHGVAVADLTEVSVKGELKIAEEALNAIDKDNTSVYNRAVSVVAIAKAKVKALQSPAYA